MADFETVRLSITKEEKMEARKLARSRGMTFYGLLGALIRRELETRLRQLLRRLVGLVLDHAGVAWDNSTFRFEFTREMITNALDNAQVAQVEAQTRNVEINTLLSLAERLDSETLMKGVCDVLDIDYEEIRDRLPDPELEGYEDIADDGDRAGAGEAHGGAAEEGPEQA